MCVARVLLTLFCFAPLAGKGATFDAWFVRPDALGFTLQVSSNHSSKYRAQVAR